MQNTTHIEQIKRNREQLRSNIRSKMKMPARRRGSADNILSAQQSPEKMKLDKRLFENAFEMKEKLGQGAHGVVYRCTETRTGRQFAVKVMSGDEQMISITKRTYSILKLFDDVSVIKNKCLFIDETRDQIFQVMEYCPFPSLRALVRENPLPYSQCKTIIKKLLETVQLINDTGVCHRDLKPDNILYDRESTSIKLIDFGVSKLVINRRKRSKDPMWTVTGTIQYKAPEMFEGRAYDILVDAWAIGVICYELVYGRLPFSDEYVSQLIDKILGGEPEFPELPDKKESALTIDFIKMLLKKEPTNRNSCKQALHHPWIENVLPRTKRPSEDFSNSLMITPLRENSSFVGGSLTFSPPLAQSTYFENTKSMKLEDQQRNPMTWSGFKLDVFELKKNLNESDQPGNEGSSSQEVISREEIELTINEVLSSSLTVFDPRNRTHSISGPQ